MMMFGLNARMSSTVSRARSNTAGSQLVRNTSALASRRPKSSRPVSDLMSIAMLRLPRFPSSRMKSASTRAAAQGNPPTTRARPGSPVATLSTLITSAPQSDNAAPAAGTYVHDASSTTRTPLSTLDIRPSLLLADFGLRGAGAALDLDRQDWFARPGSSRDRVQPDLWQVDGRVDGVQPRHGLRHIGGPDRVHLDRQDWFARPGSSRDRVQPDLWQVDGRVDGVQPRHGLRHIGGPDRVHLERHVLEHVGLDRSRRDDVNADAVTVDLERQCPRERVHRRLRG